MDEAGAGPLAGRVYAAAVILPQGWDHPYLNDSKRVTPRRRDLLYEAITQEALAWSVAWAEPEEIDAINILQARMLAMERAILRAVQSAGSAYGLIGWEDLPR